MIENVTPIFLSTTILGVVVYGITNAIKTLLPSDWRKETKLGKFTITSLPLVLGALLGWGMISSLATYVGMLLSDGEPVTVAWGSRVLLGLFSGTLATQIYAMVRNYYKAKAFSDE